MEAKTTIHKILKKVKVDIDEGFWRPMYVTECDAWGLSEKGVKRKGILV